MSTGDASRGVSVSIPGKASVGGAKGAKTGGSDKYAFFSPPRGKRKRRRNPKYYDVISPRAAKLPPAIPLPATNAAVLSSATSAAVPAATLAADPSGLVRSPTQPSSPKMGAPYRKGPVRRQPRPQSSGMRGPYRSTPNTVASLPMLSLRTPSTPRTPRALHPPAPVDSDDEAYDFQDEGDEYESSNGRTSSRGARSLDLGSSDADDDLEQGGEGQEAHDEGRSDGVESVVSSGSADAPASKRQKTGESSSSRRSRSRVQHEGDAEPRVAHVEMEDAHPESAGAAVVFDFDDDDDDEDWIPGASPAVSRQSIPTVAPPTGDGVDTDGSGFDFDFDDDDGDEDWVPGGGDGGGGGNGRAKSTGDGADRTSGSRRPTHGDPGQERDGSNTTPPSSLSVGVTLGIGPRDSATRTVQLMMTFDRDVDPFATQKSIVLRRGVVRVRIGAMRWIDGLRTVVVIPETRLAAKTQHVLEVTPTSRSGVTMTKAVLTFTSGAAILCFECHVWDDPDEEHLLECTTCPNVCHVRCARITRGRELTPLTWRCRVCTSPLTAGGNGRLALDPPSYGEPRGNGAGSKSQWQDRSGGNSALGATSPMRHFDPKNVELLMAHTGVDPQVRAAMQSALHAVVFDPHPTVDAMASSLLDLVFKSAETEIARLKVLGEIAGKSAAQTTDTDRYGNQVSDRDDDRHHDGDDDDDDGDDDDDDGSTSPEARRRRRDLAQLPYYDRVLASTSTDRWKTLRDLLASVRGQWERRPVAAVGNTLLVYDTRMLEHEDQNEELRPFRMERPQRILSIYNLLIDHGLAERCVEIKPRPAKDNELLLCHEPEHLDDVRAGDPTLYIRHTSDFYICSRSDMAARLACGGVIDAAVGVVRGAARNAIAVVRPPGHHAMCNVAQGFCLYNNVAVAARCAQQVSGVQRVMIVDWDIHHGNGTQAMFYDDPSVLYLSLHRYTADSSFYPDSDIGNYTWVGEGAGEGFNINIAWDLDQCGYRDVMDWARKRLHVDDDTLAIIRRKKLSGRRLWNMRSTDKLVAWGIDEAVAKRMLRYRGMGDADYIAAFRDIVVPTIHDYRPDLVIVSAGFDAALGDPLGGCCVTPAGYAHMTKMLMDASGDKVVVALEGGYNLEAISTSAAAVASVLLGDAPPDIDLPAPRKHALKAIHRVQERHFDYAQRRCDYGR